MHDVLLFLADGVVSVIATALALIGMLVAVSAARRAAVRRQLRRRPVPSARRGGQPVSSMDFELARFLDAPGDLPPARQEAPTAAQKLDDGLTDAGLPHRRSQWPCSQWDSRTAHTAHTWQDPIVGTVRCPGIKP